MINQFYWIFIAESFFYSLFSNIALLLAIGTVASRNPIYSILCLIGLFVVSSFLMILVGADFLAFVYIIVYVGAIAVLFLFIIMMINVKSVPTLNKYNSNFFLLLLVPLVAITFIWSAKHQFNWFMMKGLFYKRRPEPIIYKSLEHFFILNKSMEEIILASINTRGYYYDKFYHLWLIKILPFAHKNKGGLELVNLYRIAPVTFFKFYLQYSFFYYHKWAQVDNINNIYFPAHNIEAIGLSLFSDYYFPFIICGMVLFVAMIGAITLTKYWRSESKRQEIWEQILTENTVRKTKIPFF